MRAGISCAAACAAMLCGMSSFADVVLVKDGQPLAAIVVAKSAVGAAAESAVSPPPAANKIAAAAKDLQTYIGKMTGAKLPIVADDSSPEGTLVLVGRSALTKDLDAKIPSGLTPLREEEGYAILSQGDRLLLAGNDAACYHGTEYAVAAFLGRQGVRWYMPGDFGEFVPKKRTISVGALDLVSRPDFKMRNWWCSYMSSEVAGLEARWKIRNGMNPDMIMTMPSDTSARTVLPPPTDPKNKEFLEIWGKDEKGNPYFWMPNLTSQKSVEYAANKVKEYFRANPDVYSYGISPDDGYPRDYSEETVKRNLGFPFDGGRAGVPADLNITDEWIAWIQAVAKEVYKEFPDHFLTTNGYANRNAPPISIQPDPKVWIMFAAIWADTLHAYDNPRSWQTLREAQMIQGWTAQYRNVFMYNYIYYMLVGCGEPIPLAREHMHDMPLYKKWGVIGFDDEGRTVRGETGIFPTWLRARMMWDTSLDGNALMDEFCANWYGAAAAPAKAFWEELENTMETTPWLGNRDNVLPYVYSDALIAKLEEDIKQAENLASDKVLKEHVLADRVTLEELKAFMAMSRAEWAADFAEAARQAQRMVDVRRPATALSRLYWDPDPATGEAYGFFDWGAVERRNYYKKLADMTTGKTGRMVAVLPERAKFKTDPRDDGRYWKWYAPDFKDDDWQEILTTEPFYGQGYCDGQGFPYLGAMWYRMTAQVPASAAGKSVSFYVPVVETEAWVWVNGKFIGHREYHDAYERPNAIDMDVTKALQPGKENSIVIRVQTGFGAAPQPSGLASRAFLYAPKAAAAK